jgi:hypothetical protein
MHQTFSTGVAALFLGAALVAAGSAKADTVIPDDLIVQGSACVGLDCVDGESFGFDTIRLKENNTRIKFDDTSTASGFPNNDWQLTANDSASGGLNKFSIENITVATVPFTVVGAAPTNSLFVDNNGKVGLRTSTPGLDLSIKTGNTPAQRLEQDSSGGFTAQTWDIGANEANFFVRDVTGGSRLPLRIRPGAPTSSIDINASGNIGIGTASPGTKLHVSSGATADVFAAFGPSASADAGDGLNLGYGGASFGPGGSFINAHSVTGSNGRLTMFTDNVARMTLDNVGNVGIGTASAAAKLDVNGTVRVGTLSSGATSVCFNGSNVLSTCSSDLRLKRDVRYLNDDTGLNAVMRLKPARFRWHDGDDRVMAGFVAQDTQQAIPEAVYTPSGGEFLSLDTGAVLSYAVKAIQELKADNDNLRREVERLKSKL